MLKAILAGAAIAALISPAYAAAPTETPYAIKDATGTVKNECTYVDTAGNFQVCHLNYIWNGSGPVPLLADPSSSYLGVTIEGAPGFTISGTLPGFASAPTVNLGTLGGAATATNQATANGFLSTLAGAVNGSNLQVTCTSGCSGGGSAVTVSSSALPSGAATSALQTSVGATAHTDAATGNTSVAAIATAAGTPADASYTGTNTATLISLLKANLAASQAILVGPLNIGGSVNFSGSLPAYATTPTFNLGTLNGAATAANQATQITAEQAIATNTANLATAAPSTSISGTTSSTAGTWTTLAASSIGRRGCSVQNTSTALEYVFVGSGTPSAATAYALNPATSSSAGGSFSCASGLTVISDTLQISSAAASSTFAGNTQ